MRDGANALTEAGAVALLGGVVFGAIYWLREHSRFAARMFRDMPSSFAILLTSVGLVCLAIGAF